MVSINGADLTRATVVELEHALQAAGRRFHLAVGLGPPELKLELKNDRAVFNTYVTLLRDDLGIAKPDSWPSWFAGGLSEPACTAKVIAAARDGQFLARRAARAPGAGAVPV